MRTLNGLGRRQLVHRTGRTALTGLGIALGVAILFGVSTVSTSISRSFDQLVDSFNGKSDAFFHPVGSYDAGMPADTVATVTALPDVRTANPSFGFGTTLPRPHKPIKDGDQVWLGGFDLTPLQRMYPLRLERGRFFQPGAQELVLSQRMAKRTGLDVGGTVALATPGGKTTFTLVGVLRDDVGLPGRGRMPMTSMATTQALAGRPGTVNGIDVDLAVAPDRADAWVDQHRSALGPGIVGQRAGAGADDFRQFLATMSSAFGLIASIALFVGGFLIYLTFTMAVVERTKVYGTLRALGATPKQVRRVVVREALVLGAIASPLGLVFGLGIGASMLSFVGNLLRMDRPTLAVDPKAAVFAFVLGTGTAVVASLVPARRAARLQPIVAMRGDHARDTRLGRSWVAGAVLLPLGLGLAMVTHSPGMRALTTLGTLLGAVLLVPALLRPLANGLGRLTRRIAPGVGEVAVMHLVKERSRSAYTLALVMVVLAMLFSVASLSSSMNAAMNEVLDRQFASDIAFDSRSTFSPEMEQRFAATPGIARTSTLRFGQVPIVQPGKPDRSNFLLTIDPATYFDVSSYAWRVGSDATVKQALLGGGSVAVTAPLADSLGLKMGDQITLRTVDGPKPFRIAGLMAGFGSGQPIVIGIADGQRWFNVGRPHTLLADVTPGTSTDTVVKRLEHDLVPLGDFSVNPSTEIKAGARAQLNGFFGLFYGLLAVAAVVGLLGLANTMAVSVVQRYREIGVLRAIGTRQGQIRRMVTAETATLVLVAVCLALPLGLGMSVALVRASSATLGYTVSFRFPLAVPFLLVVGGLALTVAASFLPGRRAARMPVVGALQFE